MLRNTDAAVPLRAGTVLDLPAVGRRSPRCAIRSIVPSQGCSRASPFRMAGSRPESSTRGG